MKQWMKNVTLVCSVAALTGTALGGSRLTVPVDINVAVGYARGSLGDARNSADAVQYIGCYNASSVGSTIVLCEAQDAGGVYRSCVTTDVNMVATARSISGGSFLYFQWNASGNCTALQVTSYSLFRPATP